MVLYSRKWSNGEILLLLEILFKIVEEGEKYFGVFYFFLSSLLVEFIWNLGDGGLGDIVCRFIFF